VAKSSLTGILVSKYGAFLLALTISPLLFFKTLSEAREYWVLRDEVS